VRVCAGPGGSDDAAGEGGGGTCAGPWWHPSHLMRRRSTLGGWRACAWRGWATATTSRTPSCRLPPWRVTTCPLPRRQV